MATIPSGTKFLGVNPALTNLTEKKGTALDSKTEYFSIEDIQNAAGGNSPLKGIQVKITQAEILNSSGFTKLLVAPVTGKVLIPISISIYRKSGGTGYTISNSVRLFSDDGSSSSSIGTALDSAFQNSIAGAVMQSITSSFNTVVVSGNSLKLVSGNLLSPSAITGGTGDLIASIVYAEVDTTV